jgi:hypothetical protein
MAIVNLGSPPAILWGPASPMGNGLEIDGFAASPVAQLGVW